MAYTRMGSAGVPSGDLAAKRPPSPTALLDDKARDSAVCMDMDDMCGILEHATVDDGDDLAVRELDVSHELSYERLGLVAGIDQRNQSCEMLCHSSRMLHSSSSSTDEAGDLTACIDADSHPFPVSRRSASAPPGSLPLLDAAVRPVRVVDATDVANSPAPLVALMQPVFPPVFDLFDYGDGTLYYLGGGGTRVTRNLSRRQRRTMRQDTHNVPNAHARHDSHGFWPFENPPLYACQVHPSSSGRPAVVLHSGRHPDRDGAWADVQFGRVGRCARAISAHPFNRGITLGLPPMMLPWTVEQPLAGVDNALRRRTEEALRVCLSWPRRYQFAVEVADESAGSAGGRLVRSASEPRREVFEWRPCSGAELEALESQEALEALEALGHQIVPRGPDDEEQPTKRPRYNRLGRWANAAGRASRRLWRTVMGRRGRGVQPSPAAPAPGQRSRWRGGWQLVRLVDAPPSRLADALQATEGKRQRRHSTSSTSNMSSTASMLALDRLIGEEAGHAAERRRAPDGHEIVAMWANVADEDGTRWGTAATARFLFLGSGKSGQLGERWALTAVVSGLAIWERERRVRQRRQNTVVSACNGLASIGG